MKKLLFLTSLILTITINADEFSDLKNKKEETIAKNPFANNKASCSSTTSTGVKLTESWHFFKTAEGEIYLRDLGGIIHKGSYTLQGSVLKLKQTSSKVGLKETLTDVETDLKFKITPKGFDYIFTNKIGTKLLYECIWTGSSMSKF